MIERHSKTSPLQQSLQSPLDTRPMNWRERGVGLARIVFGLVWVVDAILKWQPPFQNTFVAQVAAARDGQPAFVQTWITLWVNIVSLNPLLFARVEATTETALAIFLLLGIFSNLTSVVGILLSLVIWTVPEGFGGPYIPGSSTDIGTAFPYAILFVVLLCLAAGRYYGLDQWLTPRLGRWGFLASSSIKRGRNRTSI